MVFHGSVTAALHQLVAMLLPSKQRDEGKRLRRRGMTVWVAELGAFCLARTTDSVMPETLVSVAEPIAVEGMMVVDGY